MCGIAGIISPDPSLVTRVRLQQMTHTLAHRGPDGEGFFINETGTAGFGHRRLSIIDLSIQAAQPMHYMGRYTILHNGEIYNYLELKEELQKKGYQFNTLSDTEVIAAAYDCFKTDCLQYFDGMFAFTIWDEQQQELFAARDRFGEKPFYYSDNGEEFVFASEIKGLWAAGKPRIADEALLLQFLGIGTMSNPVDDKTFYRDIHCLPPSHYLILGLKGQGYTKTIKRYWDIDKSIQHNGASVEDLSERFREKFFLSVTRRLRSDVPLGTSLSGGLDSSAIAAAICNTGMPGHPLKTFSAVFPGFIKDESKYVEMLVRHCGLESYSVTPTTDGFIKDFEKLIYHHEEPISSMSIYAQFKVFELAKAHDTKVLLDGQGADELMAGYGKHIHWYLMELLASGQRKEMRVISEALNRNKVNFQWGWENYIGLVWPRATSWQLTQRAARHIRQHPFITKDFKQAFLQKDLLLKPVVKTLNDILYADTFQHMLPDLLRYADRNSMAHGREVRLPYLNHSLAEFLFSLPSSYKIRDGYSKYILRSAMKDLLPADITWRKDKTAFEPPQKEWMGNKTIQEYIHEAKKTLVGKGILRESVLQEKIQPLDAHAAGNYDWRYLVIGSLLRSR